jgi:phage terminase large subunit GpA-like protein
LIAWTEPEIAAWTPKERLTVSAWAEKYRELKAQAEEKGPLSMARTPYLGPILNLGNRIDPNPRCNQHGVSFQYVDEVVFCKPAQIAGTEGVISLVGYFTHQEPCTVICCLADEDTSSYVMNNRMAPMYRDSETLSKLIVQGHFNANEMAFHNGAYILSGWASSVSKIASRPAKIIVADEIDKPGYYTKSKEASALSLLRERKEAFYSGQFWMLSTPTVEGGNMHVELAGCDAIYDWHVPCPHCGQYQPLRWSMKYAPEFPNGIYRDRDGKPQQIGGVSWEGGRAASREQIMLARYQCGSCGEKWTAPEKDAAVSAGEMVPRTEIKYAPRRVGFHINRLYSLLGKSGDVSKLVGDWCQIHRTRDSFQLKKKKQGFINSTLAGFWKEVIVRPEVDDILKAKCLLKVGTVPAEAVALTAGVDMQKHGFFYVVRAWARNYTSWLAQYGYLETWADLEALLFETTWPGDAGEQHRIWRACLDTGGGKSGYEDFTLTEQAYFWLRKNAIGRGGRVWGTKGSARPLAGKLHIGKAFDKTPSGKPLPGGLQVIQLNAGALKDMYHYRLAQAREGGEQAAYLHADTGQDYARHILAEEKQVDKDGEAKWIQVGRDNHWLDCEALAMVCAEPEWPGGGVHLIRPRQAQEKTGRRILSRGIE